MFQIFNDGACIRVENGTKILLVAKEQVKTIDTIQTNIVRIDIGEGPLKNIFINYQDVTAPVVASANELRDLIKAMLVSDQYDGGDATEQGQLNILSKLTDMSAILETIKLSEVDLSKVEPSVVDESNPNMIYKGWHKGVGNPSANEWAIQRIRREDDVNYYEWAWGAQNQVHVWNDRTQQYFLLFDYTGAVGLPLPE
jgi:hypothetical protein